MQPSPDPLSAVTPSQRAALWLPFAYLLQTRLHSWRLLSGWVLGFVIPVLALAVLGRGELVALPVAVCMLVAVYAAYEFGYLVNDAVVAVRETHPTERLSWQLQWWYAERLHVAAVARLAIGFAALAAAGALGGHLSVEVVLGWLALWPLFALYNHWRGRTTIALYLVLNGLRFVLPVAAAAGAEAALPAWPAWLLLYAVPNTYVAAWKARYRLALLQRPFGGESRFRFLWHASLAMCSLAVLAWSGSTPALHYAMVAVWLLLMRVIALRLQQPAA